MINFLVYLDNSMHISKFYYFIIRFYQVNDYKKLKTGRAHMRPDFRTHQTLTPQIYPKVVDFETGF